MTTKLLKWSNLPDRKTYKTENICTYIFLKIASSENKNERTSVKKCEENNITKIYK